MVQAASQPRPREVREGHGPPEPAKSDGANTSDADTTRVGRRPLREVVRENESLKRLVSVTSHIRRLALQGADLHAITAVLASSTGRTIVVLDPMLEPLAAAGQNGMGPDVDWVGRDAQLVQVLRAVAESRQALRIPAAADLGRPGCVIAPILFGDDVFAYLVAVEGNGVESSDFDLLVTEHAASAYAIGMAQSRVVAEISVRVKDDLIEALLLGHVRDEREGRDWAQALGYDTGRSHRVVCLVPERLSTVTGLAATKDPATTALRRRILRSLTTLVGSLASAAITSARREELVVVLPEPRPGERTVDAHQLGRAATRHLESLVARARMTVGIGGRCTAPTDLAQSYLQAQRAISIGRRLGRDGELIDFDDLGIYRLLFQVPDNRELLAFASQVLGPLIAYDKTHRAGLVRTLSVYLTHNGSLHAAAERLHIHPNTVNYRLNRITQISSLCLTDHEDRLAAEVAVKILEVLEET